MLMRISLTWCSPSATVKYVTNSLPTLKKNSTTHSSKIFLTGCSVKAPGERESRPRSAASVASASATFTTRRTSRWNSCFLTGDERCRNAFLQRRGGRSLDHSDLTLIRHLWDGVGTIVLTLRLLQCVCVSGCVHV